MHVSTKYILPSRATVIFNAAAAARPQTPICDDRRQMELAKPLQRHILATFARAQLPSGPATAFESWSGILYIRNELQ